jgi:metal-sulfur cluster biosynthetic enzyme
MKSILIIDQANVNIIMTITSLASPVAGILPTEEEQKIRNIPRVSSSSVAVILEPAWSKDMISESAQLGFGIM